MKVREVMARLQEKDPDDIVDFEVKVRLWTNNKKHLTIEGMVPITKVASGNTPVLLKGELNIDVKQTLEVF